MQKNSVLLLFIFLISISSRSQNNTPVSFNGLYIVESGTVQGDAGFKIYTYLRFYKDNSVCLQAGNSL